MIRVLIAEDSVTQREILRRLLDGDGAFTVVAEARDGNEALSRVQENRPEVVLMDIHMPDIDGIEATRRIMQQCPVPIVVASSTLRKRDVDFAMHAYEAGAVSVIAKPEGAVLLHLQEIAPTLRAELLAASQARVGKSAGESTVEPAPPVQAGPGGPLEVVGLCASTGGPPVLVEILSSIPRPFPLPVLLVQHISQGFEEGFARWLSSSTGQPVRLAAGGERLAPGIWIAPRGRHLTLGPQSRIVLLEAQPEEIHCPSGDRLFESLAQHTGAKAAGIVLTGMGNDGAHGLHALRQAGATTIVQDDASCMVAGMPRAARKCGAALKELSPAGIATLLRNTVQAGERMP